MSGLNINNSRLQFKFSTISGTTPTIGPSTDFTDGTWIDTDLYVGEFFLNAADNNMWVRTLTGIVPITSGTTTVDISAFVNKTGDTMSGNLYLPALSASTISGNTIYSNHFEGNFYGDGSNLTGITATVFTGGTISGPVTFTDIVDFCSGDVTIDSLSSCGDAIDIFTNLNVVGAITATTYYGDGSNLSGIEAVWDGGIVSNETTFLSGVTFDAGATGTFYGDGSNLTGLTSYTYITEDTIAETLTLNPPTFSLLSGTGGAELRTADDYISPTVESYVNLSNSTAIMRAYDSSGEGSVSVNESVSTLASLSGSNQSSLQISHYNSLSSTDGSSNSMLVKDSTINKGLVYYDDYSTNFTNNSLISKKYVDNAISGFTTGYTYITEDTIAETLVLSGANSIVTTVTGVDNTDTLKIDGDEIRLTALGPNGQTNYLTVNRDIIANYASLEDVTNNYAYETLSPTQKNINIYDDTSAQSTYTLSQTSELTRIEDGSGGLSECNITSGYLYLLNTSGEGKNNWMNVQPDYVEMKQDEGSSVTRLQVSNDGFYKSQFGSTGISKGVSKTNFTSAETTDATPLTLVWPLSDLEVGTTAVGIKATVTGINSTDDKAYLSELYAAVRMNAYAVTIFGGVDKLEKSEYTTATSTIDIDSLNAAIIVTGEVGETIRWSVKYELIYSV